MLDDLLIDVLRSGPLGLAMSHLQILRDLLVEIVHLSFVRIESIVRQSIVDRHYILTQSIMDLVLFETPNTCTPLTDVGQS